MVIPDNIPTLAAFKALRKGDRYHVATMTDLFKHKRELKAVIEGIHRRGAIAVVDDTGMKSTSVDFVLAAIDALHSKSYFIPSEEASRRAKIGSKKRMKRPMAKAAALRIWRDLQYTSEVASQKIGVSTITAYRWLGPRGAPAGRPKGARRGKN